MERAEELAELGRAHVLGHGDGGVAAASRRGPLREQAAVTEPHDVHAPAEVREAHAVEDDFRARVAEGRAGGHPREPEVPRLDHPPEALAEGRRRVLVHRQDGVVGLRRREPDRLRRQERERLRGAAVDHRRRCRRRHGGRQRERRDRRCEKRESPGRRNVLHDDPLRGGGLDPLRGGRRCRLARVLRHEGRDVVDLLERHPAQEVLGCEPALPLHDRGHRARVRGLEDVEVGARVAGLHHRGARL